MLRFVGLTAILASIAAQAAFSQGPTKGPPNGSITRVKVRNQADGSALGEFTHKVTLGGKTSHRINVNLADVKANDFLSKVAVTKMVGELRDGEVSILAHGAPQASGAASLFSPPDFASDKLLELLRGRHMTLVVEKPAQSDASGAAPGEGTSAKKPGNPPAGKASAENGGAAREEIRGILLGRNANTLQVLVDGKTRAVRDVERANVIQVFVEDRLAYDVRQIVGPANATFPWSFVVRNNGNTEGTFYVTCQQTVPAWKVNRYEATVAASPTASLQGWALVENATLYDWPDCKIATLVDGHLQGKLSDGALRSQEAGMHLTKLTVGDTGQAAAIRLFEVAVLDIPSRTTPLPHPGEVQAQQGILLGNDANALEVELKKCPIRLSGKVSPRELLLNAPLPAGKKATDMNDANSLLKTDSTDLQAYARLLPQEARVPVDIVEYKQEHPEYSVALTNGQVVRQRKRMTHYTWKRIANPPGRCLFLFFRPSVDKGWVFKDSKFIVEADGGSPFLLTEVTTEKWGLQNSTRDELERVLSGLSTPSRIRVALQPVLEGLARVEDIDSKIKKAQARLSELQEKSRQRATEAQTDGHVAIRAALGAEIERLQRQVASLQNERALAKHDLDELISELPAQLAG